MRVYEKKLKDDLKDIKCDFCETSCKTSLGDYEFAQLSASWGYSSKKDGEEYNFDICENCFDKILEFAKTLKK